MLSIKIICVGKVKEKYYTAAINEYIKRLDRYCKLEIVEIAEHRLSTAPSQMEISFALEKESNSIRSIIHQGSYIVALCIEGQEIDSLELSVLLEKCASTGKSKLCFIIGGSHGLHNSIKTEADIMLSLSKMTFSHSLARVVLLEQLYRALNISDGGKYHK